jgi:uncharacterized caspase-like protein
MHRSIRVLGIVFFSLVLATSAYAEKRVALVIGNAGYQSVPRLGNPGADATAIGAALQRLGFTVRNETDVGFDAMRRALRDFARVTEGADFAVIYYAGHGMEVGGENYLVPVDAKLASDVDVPYEAIPLSLAMDAVAGARGTRLIILDACRNNPFLAKMQVGAKSRSLGRGLARIEPDVGTLVAYAAKEGTTAEDGDAEHSPFAKALLQHIEEPGIDIQFLLREVRDTVLEDTNGNQEPFTYGSLPGRAVLLSPAKEPPPPPPARESQSAPPPPVPAAPETGDNIAAEVAYWNTVKDSGDRKLLESYLQEYPNGRFATLAKIFVSRLDAEPPKPPQAPAPVTAPPPPPVAAEAPAGAGRSDRAGASPPPDAQALAATEAEGGSSAPAKAPATPPPVGSGDVGEASKAIGPVASLPPAAEAGASVDLVRNIQNELSRLGCSAGAADGVWGAKGRSAVEAFARYSRLSLASFDPSDKLLTILQAYGGRVCPLACGSRYEAKGDRCVPKTCPRGMALNGSGTCYTVRIARPYAPPPQAQPAPAAPPPDSVDYGNLSMKSHHR